MGAGTAVLTVLLRSARVPFLILAPVCVLLGAATATADGAAVGSARFWLIMLGAVFAHVSVNALNEYADFRSGLDLHTTRTAFSGGSGALPEHPRMAAAVGAMGLGALLIVVAIGVYLLVQTGPGLLPLGAAGVLLVLTYTPYINRYPLLCLIAPGAGFGLLIVTGTHYVLTGAYSPAVFLAAMVPFFLVNNLLLLNQYPDIDADKAAGRNHLPIAYGIRISNAVYAGFLGGTAVCIIGGVGLRLFPSVALSALLPVPLGVYALTGAMRLQQRIGSAPRYLAANVAVAILVPCLLALALV